MSSFLDTFTVPAYRAAAEGLVALLARDSSYAQRAMVNDGKRTSSDDGDAFWEPIKYELYGRLAAELDMSAVDPSSTMWTMIVSYAIGESAGEWMQAHRDEIILTNGDTLTVSTDAVTVSFD